MSRTRRAGIAAGFGYLQFALAFVSGIVMVPFILRQVGTEAYGLWLGYGELLAYSAMVDLGILNVLPWLVAESDGRGDREEMRRLLAGGVALGATAAVVFAAVAALLLALAPGLTGITPEQRALVAGPLMLVVVGMAIAFPVRAFSSVLMGLQDVTFMGALAVAQVGLNVALVVALLLAGQGLWALAAAAVVPGLVGGMAALVRLFRIAPDLLRGWTLPPLPLVRTMGAQGLGAWTSSLGWRMVAASNALVVLSVAGPVAAVAYSVTARLGEVTMQMSWQLPDAGLVGLAQLKGEGRADRVRDVTVALLRLVLLGSGAVACGVLAFNPAFVGIWVGAERFGGLALNAALAALVLGHSFAHGLFTTSSTLGTRVQAGWFSIAQGAVHVVLAVTLGRAMGITGVALAGVASSALVAVPAGVWMLRRTTGMGGGDIWRRAFGPWAVRAIPLLALGLGVGMAGRVSGLPAWAPLALAPLLGVLYLWTMRSLLDGIPLPERVRRGLAALRLLPAP